MIEPAAALDHWAKWAVDTGSWRKTCYSAEGNYANATERYVWGDDAEKHFRFRYDEKTGQHAERLINTLASSEKSVLRARHILWPHLTDELVAKRIGMTRQAFDIAYMAARGKFGRIWRESHKVAA